MSNISLLPPPQLTRGWKLRMALEQAGLSVSEVATKMEVSRSTVSRWLHDDPRSPLKARDLRDLAALCRVPIDWFDQTPVTDNRDGDPDGSSAPLTSDDESHQTRETTSEGAKSAPSEAHTHSYQDCEPEDIEYENAA